MGRTNSLIAKCKLGSWRQCEQRGAPRWKCYTSRATRAFCRHTFILVFPTLSLQSPSRPLLCTMSGCST